MGFVGGLPFVSLLGRVPADPGVYVIVWPHPERPEFRVSSPAGRFKGKDPSVPVDRLATQWVDGAAVIYIGKAAARRTRRGASRRVPQVRGGRERCALGWPVRVDRVVAAGRFTWRGRKTDACGVYGCSRGQVAVR